MKYFMLTMTGALALGACGAADEGTSAQDENTASEAEALLNQWTPYVSEEAPGFQTCGTTQNVGVTAARCTGSYCDNMGLYCSALPATFSSFADNVVWTSYVSEEQPAGVMCPAWGVVPRIIDGIAATGSFADNVAVRCRPAQIDLPNSNCGWTPYFSEEQGTQQFRYNSWSYQPAVALGVRCSGSYCDNLSFYVCEPKCTSNSQCFDVCVNGVCTIG
jgi:hypothetical protein